MQSGNTPSAVFRPFMDPARTEGVVRELNSALRNQRVCTARTAPATVDAADRELLAALCEDYLRRYRASEEEHPREEYAQLIYDFPFL